MKKLSIISLFLAAILLFAACAESTQAESAEPSQSEIKTEEPEQPTLRLLKTGDYSNGSGNANGYYGISYFEDNTIAGWRMDFETMQQTRLCTVPNCAHTGDTCGALPSKYDARADNLILADTDRLYWIFGYGEKAKKHIEVSDLDGANRHTVYTFEENEFPTGRIMATDGENIYLHIVTESEAAKDRNPREIVKINLETKETLWRYSLDNYYDSFIDVWDNKIIIESSYVPKTAPVQPEFKKYHGVQNFSEFEPYLCKKFTAISPNGDSKTLFDMGNVKLAGRFSNGFVYELEGKQLYKTDVKVGEKTKLSELPDAPDLQIAAVWDDHVIASSYYDPEATRRLFIVDENGTVTESKLYRAFKGEQDVILPICETADDFLVPLDDLPVKRTLIGTGGAPYEIIGSHVNYVLINKQKYFNGEADYREITLLPQDMM